MPSPAVDHLERLRGLALERNRYIRANAELMSQIRSAVEAAEQAGHSHAEIIEASGLARRTIYKYLPVKEDQL